MLAIWKREFKSLFQNVIGWLFLGVTLALFGLYFFVYNLSYGYPYVSYSLSAISFIFMITVPVLTMRVFAEERRSKTDQLLLTAPVSLWKVVLGKYLALAAAYTLGILVICISPIVLRIFGEVPLLETYVSILGFWLYGLSCIAIGTFASSLTESQVVSAVISFGLIFLGYMMSSLTSIGNWSETILAKVIGCYDLYAPLQDFMNGTLPLAGILYYLSIIFLALFFAYEVMQKRRWSVSKKMISISVFSVGTIVLCTVAVILGNFGFSKIPVKYTEFDVTSKKIYSITEDTKKYLKNLEEDITIYVYVNKKNKDENVDKTLSKYVAASKHIDVKYIDPSTNPKFASKYTDEELNTNSLIVVGEEKSKVIDYGSQDNSMVDSQIYEYTMDSSTYSYVASGYDCEGQVTAAIQYVTSDDNVTVYELTGHDEISLSSSFTEIFEKRFIQMESLNLLQAESVPEDCEALFISAPQSDLSGDDLEKLKEYVDGGGAIYCSLDYQNFDKLENFQKLLLDSHIEVVDGIVGESDTSYYYQNAFYLLPIVESTEISSDVAGNASVFVPYCMGLRYTGSEENEETYLSFMSTSEKSFAKSRGNIEKERTTSEEQQSLFEKEEQDVSGPFDLGVMVTNSNGGKMIVVGSSYMFTENANDIVSGKNAKLFQGIVSGMVNEEEENSSAVVIPAKDYSVSSLTISQRTMLVYGILWGIIMPIAMIISGVIIWVRRKKK